jgi:hypothetical protein
MIEPAITLLSAPFYRLLHHEPVRMDVDPLGTGSPEGRGDPAEGNQAVPTLLVTRFRESLRAAVPEIELRRVTWTSLFCYPLSGGFQPWSLLPRSVVPRLLAVERRLAPAIGRIAAFRLLIVLAKRS